MALTAAAGAAPHAPRLRRVHTWAFAIGDGALAGSPARLVWRYARYDLLVVDGEEATAPQIAALRAHGRRVVLGYLDVGTIESHRSRFAREAVSARLLGRPGGVVRRHRAGGLQTAAAHPAARRPPRTDRAPVAT